MASDQERIPAVLAKALNVVARSPVGPKLVAEKPRRNEAADRERFTTAQAQQALLVWTEFGNFKKTAKFYACHVRTWGRASSLAGVEPWPPCDLALAALASAKRCGCCTSSISSGAASCAGRGGACAISSSVWRPC